MRFCHALLRDICEQPADRFESNLYAPILAQRRRQLLDYTKSAVTRNKSEKKINSLLDYVSASPNMQLLQDFYATTLSALQASLTQQQSRTSLDHR